MKIFKKIELDKDELERIDNFENLLQKICTETNTQCKECYFNKICDKMTELIVKNFNNSEIKVSAAPEKNK